MGGTYLLHKYSILLGYEINYGCEEFYLNELLFIAVSHLHPSLIFEGKDKGASTQRKEPYPQIL
jgi:hypothetical protein